MCLPPPDAHHLSGDIFQSLLTSCTFTSWLGVNLRMSLGWILTSHLFVLLKIQETQTVGGPHDLSVVQLGGGQAEMHSQGLITCCHSP